jgi:hypothetical protein
VYPHLVVIIVNLFFKNCFRKNREASEVASHFSKFKLPPVSLRCTERCRIFSSIIINHHSSSTKRSLDIVLLSVHQQPSLIMATSSSLNDLVPAGVITGDDVLTLFEHARSNGYAIPAVNCTRCVVVS